MSRLSGISCRLAKLKSVAGEFSGIVEIASYACVVLSTTISYSLIPNESGFSIAFN